MSTTAIITSIITVIKGKNVEARRIAALEAKGFKVSFEGVKWNFGTACTVKEIKGTILAQLHCATGCKGRNGGSFNRCDVFTIAL